MMRALSHTVSTLPPEGMEILVSHWIVNHGASIKILNKAQVSFPGWQYRTHTVTHQCQVSNAVVTPRGQDNRISTFGTFPLPYARVLLADSNQYSLAGKNCNCDYNIFQ